MIFFADKDMENFSVDLRGYLGPQLCIHTTRLLQPQTVTHCARNYPMTYTLVQRCDGAAYEDLFAARKTSIITAVCNIQKNVCLTLELPPLKVL